MSDERPQAPVRPDPDRGAMGVVKDLGHVSVLAALCASLPALGGFAALGAVIAQAGKWKPWVAERIAWAVPAYALAFALTTGLALMPTYALSIIAGYLFGFAWAAPAALLGVVVGSVIGFAWASGLARERVMSRIGVNAKAAAVRSAIVDRGAMSATGVVALLRFPPNSPFAVTNLVMGATGVRFGPFLIGTALGMAPRTMLAVYIGSAAADLGQAIKSGGGRWKWIGMGVMLGVVLGAYWLFNRWAMQAIARLNSAPGSSGGGPTGTGADDPALG